MGEPRTAAELIAFAAWVNLPVDELPPEMRGHTCEDTMKAWRRVASALIEYAHAAGPEIYTAQQAEIARLREALERIDKHEITRKTTMMERLQNIAHIARTALNKGPDGGE